MHHGLRNELLRSKGGEQLLYDIVLVQLGLNILIGNIAKYSQADLNERAVGDDVTQKGRDKPCLLGNKWTWESRPQLQ